MNESEAALDLLRLKALLNYDPFTGIFKWKVRVNGGRRKVGDPAGYFGHKRGYVVITVGGKRFLAHRLAWFYHYSKWPSDIIDHRDGDTSHNWITN